MNRKPRVTVSFLLLALFATTAASADDDPRMHRNMVFQSSFDDTTDVNLFGFPNDAGWIYTSESTKRETVLVMNRRQDVTIAKDQGRLRDSLRFASRGKQVLYYQASPSLSKPRRNWSGAVSLWIKPEPVQAQPPSSRNAATNIPDAYPILMFDGDWNHGGFFVRLPAKKEDTLEFGVVSAAPKTSAPVWDLKDVKKRYRETISTSKGYSGQANWTLMTFSFENINGDPGAMSTATLYLNGKPQGALQRPIQIDWMSPEQRQSKPKAAMFLGLQFVGQLDDLRVYERPFSASQALKLYQLDE